MTVRTVHDAVVNALDYLREAELALFTNVVSMTAGRVSWHPLHPEKPFLINHDHLTVEQFSDWVLAGHYSCILFDGSLLQITYDIDGREVCGHRLAYVPCPVTFDFSLLNEEPLNDLVEVYVANGPSAIALRTPVRFDFDPAAASTDTKHPAAHMTINSVHCRIACVAPMHVGRFLDFVFRNFYPELRSAHSDFFDAGAHLHLGKHVLLEERRVPHLAWEQAKESLRRAAELAS